MSCDERRGKRFASKIFYIKRLGAIVTTSAAHHSTVWSACRLGRSESTFLKKSEISTCKNGWYTSTS